MSMSASSPYSPHTNSHFQNHYRHGGTYSYHHYPHQPQQHQQQQQQQQQGYNPPKLTLLFYLSVVLASLYAGAFIHAIGPGQTPMWHGLPQSDMSWSPGLMAAQEGFTMKNSQKRGMRNNRTNKKDRKAKRTQRKNKKRDETTGQNKSKWSWKNRESQRKDQKSTKTKKMYATETSSKTKPSATEELPPPKTKQQFPKTMERKKPMQSNNKNSNNKNKNSSARPGRFSTTNHGGTGSTFERELWETTGVADSTNRQQTDVQQPAQEQQGGGEKSYGTNAGSQTSGATVDFTLITHLSLDQVMVMKQHCSRWNNRISIAIATRRSVTVVNKAIASLGCDMSRINIRTVPYNPPKIGGPREVYPVDQLWTAAMDGLNTSHAVVVNNGFVLSENAYDVISGHRSVLANEDNTTLLLPAFKTRLLCPEGTEQNNQLLPRTVEDIRLLMDGKAPPDGHSIAWYQNWIAQDGHTRQQVNSFTSDLNEPALVVRANTDVSMFSHDDKLNGQNSEVTWFEKLQRNGNSKVLQLGGVFAVCFPQPPPTQRIKNKNQMM